MIRPLTCLAFLLACGSGLYVYQAKHRVQVLDQQIAQTVKSTDALREQTRMLHAEWTLLNDPARLRQLSDQFLTLKTVAPGQFTSLAELDSRLPPPAPPPAAPAAPVVAQADGSPDTQLAGNEAAKAADLPLPIPPKEVASPPPRVAATVAESVAPVERRPAAAKAVPAPTRVATAEQRPFEPRPAEPRAAEPRPMEPRMAEQRPVETRAWQRNPDIRPVAAMAPPRPMPPAPQPVAAGSMLGMAHGTPAQPVPLPLPRPVPLNTAQWSYSNGG